VNYIITAKPIQLPVYSDRPETRPVASVSDSASEFRDASKQPPSTYVYRGELLEAVANDRRYRPQLNLQIDPDNRRAIDTYQRVASDPPLMGRLLDGFI
jgi:hypothetical protein